MTNPYSITRLKFVVVVKRNPNQYERGMHMTESTKGSGFAIQTFSISRKFGDLVAVDGIDLSVKEGELFSLLGPNGAGKTVTIKMLCCLLRPSSGTATIMGHDIRKDPIAVKEVIDVSPQETAIAEHLNARENLVSLPIEALNWDCRETR